MGEPSARWVWNIHWSTRRLAFRVVLFTCRMCRIMPVSSKIRKILSTLQLHSGMDCCLPTYVVISLLSSVLHLSRCVALCCISLQFLTCFSPVNCLLITCYRLLFASTSFTVNSLLCTPPGAIITRPACVSSILFETQLSSAFGANCFL